MFRNYDSLDELAQHFHPGQRIKFHHVRRDGTFTAPMRGTVQGFVYSLPYQPGGPSEPGLVITTWEHSTIGCVYPFEVTYKEELRQA